MLIKTFSDLPNFFYLTPDLFWTMVEDGSFGIISIDRRGEIKRINGVARALFNIPSLKSIHIKDILPEVWEKIETYLRVRKFPPYLKVKEKIAKLSFVFNKSGGIDGFVLIFERKKEKRDLSSIISSSEIFNASYDGLYLTDGVGNTIDVSPSYEQISGLDRGEVVGKNMRELVKSDVFSQSVTLLVLRSKRRETILQFVKTGKKLLVTGNPIFDERNRIKMVLTNVRDIIELNRIAKELEERKKLFRGENLKRCVETSIGRIVYSSKAMDEVIRVAKMYAKTETPIMLLGETGVGKDLIANFIHENSKRANKPFVKVNCAAIPKELFESEFFGYEKGAFTGANREGKPGVFEMADGGTLFLNEVGEVPYSVQAKFLQVLEEFSVKRVGGKISRPINVRIISATNRDLKKMVKEKKFRIDLFFRLFVLPLEIPPLRERKEDIEPLLEEFLEQFGKREKKEIRISKSAISTLYNYEWPGNVRELKNMVERVVITCKEKEISDISPYLIKFSEEETCQTRQAKSLKEAIREFEREFIRKALLLYGNPYRAAKALGVNPSTISRKIKKFL